MLRGAAFPRPFVNPQLLRVAAYGTAVAVLVYGLVEWEIVTRLYRDGHVDVLGKDVRDYLGYTRAWLDTGTWYTPQQLAGPYVVEDLTANVYPPTLLYLTVPFALGLPMFLWWAIPAGIVAFTLWRRPPAWWAWPILAFVFAWMRTSTVILLGNPAMWSVAFAVAGTAWGWPAVLAAVKLPFAPLAFVGVRHRSWWLVAGLCLLACVPFGALWLDYVRVLLNASSSRGAEYLLGEWPMALGLMVVAASGSISGSGRRASSRKGRARS